MVQIKPAELGRWLVDWRHIARTSSASRLRASSLSATCQRTAAALSRFGSERDRLQFSPASPASPRGYQLVSLSLSLQFTQFIAYEATTLF